MKTTAHARLVLVLLVSLFLAGGCTGTDDPDPNHPTHTNQPSALTPTDGSNTTPERDLHEQARPALSEDAARIDQTVQQIAEAHSRLINEANRMKQELEILRARLEAQHRAIQSQRPNNNPTRERP